MTDRITLKNIRIVYPHLQVKGKDYNDPSKDSDKFEATFIIPKDHPQLKQLQKLIADTREETVNKFPDEELEFTDKSRQCLVDGDSKLIKLSKYPYFENAFRLRAKSTRMVPCFDKFGNALENADSIIESGDYVSAQFTFYGSKNMDGLIGANLLAVVQKEKGEPIGGVSAKLDDFDFIEIENDI